MKSFKNKLVSFSMMVGITISILFVTVYTVYADEAVKEPNSNKLYARSAVLMDADSGRILYEKNGYEQMPMASTTKIMTCIVTLESGKAEEVAEVSSYASSMPKVHLGMRQGEKYRVKDLLHSLMLESHNDSAVVIAEHVGGSVEGFANMMNQKALELGCENTYFITPNGLDATKDVTAANGSVVTKAHSTTAADLAKIMSYCITKSPEKDAFLEITRTPSYQFTNLKETKSNEVVSGGRTFSCTNHNAFLTMMEGALSGKTGFTSKAGYCYVGSACRDGKTYVVALLACGWPNNKSYKWKDTKNLMEYGIAAFEKKNFADCPVDTAWLKEVPVENAATEKMYETAFVNVELKDKQSAPEFLVKKGEEIKVSCQRKKSLAAPVQKGCIVGKITYRLGDSVYWERDLVAAESYDAKDMNWYVKQVMEAFFR